MLKSTYAPLLPSTDPHEQRALQAALTAALTQVVIDEIAVQGCAVVRLRPRCACWPTVG